MSIVIKNLSKSFEKKQIFDNFSLELPRKGVFMISGESGAGKTTLLRMILGLDTSYTGEILGGGVKNCSVAFQEYRLFPTLSAIDNVIFANYDEKTDEIENNAKDLLLFLGFNEADIELYPDELSGGMKQRISLARAFLRKTPVLLLDEPTKELDEDNANKVLEIIKNEAKSRLVIFVSHNKADAQKLNAEVINI